MLFPFCLPASVPERLPSGVARRGALGLLLGSIAAPAWAAPRAQLPHDLQGREVWSLDETQIGTVVTMSRSTNSAIVLIAPAPGLGIGTAPFTIPLSLLREASEGRLLLIMGPGEFHARVAAAGLARP